MNSEELKAVLAAHAKWLTSGGGGRADLHNANLRRADLCGADLRRADLRRADLRDANLCGADLRGANLRNTNLCGAYLCGADLRNANLRGADLRGADLRNANLCGADLRGAKVSPYQVCPEVGEFTAYKKLAGGVVATLLIPKEAKRTSSLVGRKCRAEFVEVIALSTGDHATSNRDGTLYTVGATVHPDMYDGDPRVECTHGIHFFITRVEAEDY